MSKRYFAFESITGVDENELTKIEFGTDTRSDMRFETVLQDFEMTKSVLLLVDYLTMLKPANYQMSKIEYRDWYANELIRRVTEDRTFFEEQPDAKKEVLKELLNRRNKLMKQLDRTMNFYHDNKHQVDEMEKVRAQYQKPFPGPQIAFTGTNLIFENLTEYGDIYYQISLPIQELEETENIPGVGWVEYSKYFSDNLKSMVYTPGGLHISNAKSRTDLRVLRRGDSRPFRLLGNEGKHQLKIEEHGLIQEFTDRGFAKIVDLDVITIFQLVDGVKKFWSDNQEILIVIEPNDRGIIQAGVTPSRVKIKTSQIQKPYEIKTNSSVFLALENILHLLETGSLTLYPHNFGFALQFGFGETTGVIHSNRFVGPLENRIRKVLTKYFLTHSPTLERFNGISARLGSISYTRMAEESQYELSHRERRASLLLSTNPDDFEIIDNKVLHRGRGKAGVSWENGFLLDCDCGKSHKIYLCEHIIACLIFGYMEGQFNVQ